MPVAKKQWCTMNVRMCVRAPKEQHEQKKVTKRWKRNKEQVMQVEKKDI